MTSDLGSLAPDPPAMPLVANYGRSGPSWVYIHLNAQGDPLYVGVTGYPAERLKQHRRVSSWYPQVAEVRYLGPFANTEGADEEARLIHELQPAFNKAGRRIASAEFQPSDLPPVAAERDRRQSA